MAVKFAILTLGLWLVGSQGIATEMCCSEMPSRTAACDGCGDHSDGNTSPRPDCCTSLEAQQYIESPIPKNDLPDKPITIDVLTADPIFAPWPAETTEVVALQVAAQAEGPPLYLRYEVFLI